MENEKEEIEEIEEEEAKEVTAEEEKEEITDDEELEIEQAISDYLLKIDAIDERIDAYRKNEVDAKRRQAMKDAYYSDEQIDRYLKFIDGETASEIKSSVSRLEIPPANDNFGDPSAFNPARGSTSTRPDYEEIGRESYRRIRDRIFPSLKRRR